MTRVAGRETGRRGLKLGHAQARHPALQVAGRETGRRGLKPTARPAYPGSPPSPAGKPVGVD